jgi:hypothetical protein
MIDNPWDLNARSRHQQIVDGKDISLTKILCPELMALIEHASPNHYPSVLEVGCGTGYLYLLTRQRQSGCAHQRLKGGKGGNPF